ncbi:metallophosphoesterase [Aeromonas veronii]|uniref:peptidase inhibitor family I36 protein n=1 Tax=Aeromonas veronii TaxID=654 RepID=UPI00226CF004|nr:peptidase inhibitor family I36 protein [Aeromonas veronii]MCX9134853.1 metallophosphoesterase [Aeromonas veronii]
MLIQFHHNEMEVSYMMKIMFVFFGFLFSSVVFAESAVCLYSEVNYRGEEKCIDSMNGAGSRIKLTDFNDRAKSARIFPGFKVRLYTHYDSPGGYTELKQDTPDLMASNNVISSVSISTDETLSGYLACFWEHENYHGRRLCVKDQRDIDLWANGLNDTITSVKIQAGYGVNLFEHVGFKGEAMTLNGNNPNVGVDFNDIASSAKVFELSNSTTTVSIGSDPQLYCVQNCGRTLTEEKSAEIVNNTVLSMMSAFDIKNILGEEIKPVKAIFINGDMTEYGHSHEWRAIFDSLAKIQGRAPIYWGLGNHDYINNNNDTYQNNSYVRSIVNMWEHLKNLTSSVYDVKVYNNNDMVLKGSLAYAVDLGDIYYIQLNDQQVDSGYWDSVNQDYDTYDYNDAHNCCSFYGTNLWSAHDFLKKQLEFAAQNDKVVVIGKHRPTLSQEMADLIQSYNVKLLFAGHYHHVEINYDHNLAFYNSGSMAKGSYLKLTVDKKARTAHIISMAAGDGVDGGYINENIDLPVVSPKYRIGEGLWIK